VSGSQTEADELLGKINVNGGQKGQSGWLIDIAVLQQAHDS